MKSMLKVSLLGLSMVIIFSGVVFAELPLPLDGKEAPEFPRKTSSNPLEVLKIGNRVNITVYPEDDYIKGVEMEISSEGNIILPLIGKVKIDGMTISEAQKKLVRIIDADYLVDPEVVIEVIVEEREIDKEYLDVSVLGAVRSPSNYSLEIKDGKSITLIQAVLAAGGFSDVANAKKIKIVRKSLGGDGEVIRANAEAIISGKDQDIVLEPGDIIHVSESLF